MVIIGRKVLLKLNDFYSTLCNKLSLKLNKVKSSRSLLIKGRLLLKVEGELKIGKNVVITSRYRTNPIGGNLFSSLIISDGGVLKIGNNTGISNIAICCRNSITIGDNVLIGGDCKIYDTDFHSIEYKDRIIIGDRGKTKPVIIDDGSFIGTGCIILKGTQIGKRSVIGAGSVVTGKIGDDELWAGNPAKFIRKINKELE